MLLQYNCGVVEIKIWLQPKFKHTTKEAYLHTQHFPSDYISMYKSDSSECSKGPEYFLCRVLKGVRVQPLIKRWIDIASTEMRVIEEYISYVTLKCCYPMYSWIQANPHLFMRLFNFKL